MTVVLSNPKASVAGGAVAITELDGAPFNANISTLKFSNGAVTDNGDGSATVVTGVAGGGDASTNTAISVDGEVTLFSGVGGKILRRSTLTGVLKSAAGVLQVATSGTDYAPATTGSAILMGNGAGGFTASVVDNTTDLNKPVSTATQTALNLKANLASPTFTGTVGGITSAMVGLGNVDNTSDANKPISTATQTALNLKAPLSAPSFTGGIGLLLQPSESFIIDARTNPRAVSTIGVLRINHTAGTNGTRPIALDVNCAGFADTHAVSVNYIATGLGPGAENHGFDFSVDTDNSTGGEIAAITVSKTGLGTVNVTAVEAYPGVDLIDQQVGVTSVADANFTYNAGAYTDRTTAFGSSGTNVQIFVANTDYVYIGHSIQFNIIDVSLNIFASAGGVIPTFEYSTSGGGGWATFSPGDTTNGFRQNGTIILPVLGSWVTATVNGVAAKYWIRIRRTNAAAITVPTENTIKIIISNFCSWDKLGKVKITNMNISSLGTYANNAAALAGGLVVGDIYKSSGGSLNVVV